MNSNMKKIFSGFLVAAIVVSIFMIQSKHYFSEDLTVYEKIGEGSSFNYLIIGDSIGRGAGAETNDLRWFSQLEDLLHEQTGTRARRNMVVQSGATAFEGIYKFQNSPKFKDIDLIFIVFGENDRKYMDSQQFTFLYEKLIRNAKDRYPRAEIITIIESPLKQEPFADAIKRVSVHYGAKLLDMRVAFEASGMQAEQLTADLIHPNGNGYALYANSILKLIQKNIQSEAAIASFPKPLSKNDSFYLAEKKDISVSRGFRFENGRYISQKPGDYLEYDFEGPLLGITTIHSVEGGAFHVYVDGNYVRTLSTWWPFTRERYMYIASGLENGKHTVRIETAEKVSGRNTSEHSFIRIPSIIVAKDKEK